MIKKSLPFLLTSLLFFYNVTAQSSKDKMKSSLMDHTWKFGTGPNGKASTDSCEKYTSYKFREDGMVVIKPLDDKKCDNWTMIRVWKLVKMHDTRGKTYYGVRITEQEMPDRQSYDDFTFEDMIFLIVGIKDGVLTWVLKPPYNRPSIKDALNYFQNP